MVTTLYPEHASTAVFAVGENSERKRRRDGVRPGRVKEEDVAAVWMEQPWSPRSVRDSNGRLIEIISPGWLNGGPGPDFKNAIFRRDGGEAEKGDVELHVRSSDWKRHRHDRDPAYNNVKLHVVVFSDSAIPAILENGASLIEIELGPESPLAFEFSRSGHGGARVGYRAEVPGRCGAALSALGAEKACDLLEGAGMKRIYRKSDRYLMAINKGEGEKELYIGIAEALGYGPARRQFQKLASAAPLGVMREVMSEINHRKRSEAMEALLLGMGGLLPRPEPGAMEWDDETKNYVSARRGAWDEFSAKYNLSSVFSLDEWRLRGVRPSNYPHGRVAALAVFLAAYLESGIEAIMVRLMEEFPTEGRRAESAAWLEKLSLMFSVPEGAYWARRYTLGGGRAASPRRLVGAERAEVMVVNVLVPYLLGRARAFGESGHEEKASLIYRALPGKEGNAVIKLMKERALSRLTSKGVLRGAVRKQGIMEIHADFCLPCGEGCSACSFASYLETMIPFSKPDAR